MNRTIDLHGYRHFKLKDKFKEEIDICLENNISKLTIIHGYNHGDTILNYIYNELDKSNIKNIARDESNLGVTHLEIGK